MDEYANGLVPIMHAIIAAMEAEGVPAGPAEFGPTGDVYHAGLDTGIRFALAEPVLAQQFLAEQAKAMARATGGIEDATWANGAIALAEAVRQWG